MSATVVVVPEELAGVRVDRVISDQLDLSRAVVRRLIDAGAVTVEGATPRPGDSFPPGTRIAVHMIESDDVMQPSADVPFAIAYADDDLLVVDKPAGVTVHPGSGRSEGTLVNGLLHRFPEIEGVGQQGRWGIVHRLDRETSGLLVVARTHTAYDRLVEMMRRREVSRRYLTLVVGTFSNTTGTIEAPIGRDPANPTRMRVLRDGKQATTHYRRLAAWSLPDLALLSVTLETGRTHQIRVHMRSIGHPIVGDLAYGRRHSLADLGRPWLHARQLRFAHPTTGEMIDVISPLPGDLRDTLETLGEPDVGSVDDTSGVGR